MIGRGAVAVTFATSNDRDFPPRSTRENTACRYRRGTDGSNPFPSRGGNASDHLRGACFVGHYRRHCVGRSLLQLPSKNLAHWIRCATRSPKPSFSPCAL